MHKPVNVCGNELRPPGKIHNCKVQSHYNNQMKTEGRRWTSFFSTKSFTNLKKTQLEKDIKLKEKT